MCDSTIRAFPYDNPVSITGTSARAERGWHLAPTLVRAGAQVSVLFDDDPELQAALPAEISAELSDAKGAGLAPQRLI